MFVVDSNILLNGATCEVLNVEVEATPGISDEAITEDLLIVNLVVSTAET